MIGFIPFPRILVLCEMQSVSSRIWTRVAMSMSYDDNHYTTGTSKGIDTQVISNLVFRFFVYYIWNKNLKKVNITFEIICEPTHHKIYIHIMIKSCWQHGVPWLSLIIHHYHLLFLTGLLGCILYPYRADVSNWLGLVWLYGISTIVGYLMPNPGFTYVKYMIWKHIL